VEISHPFHPLRGQRLQVLRRRRLSGRDTLIVREPTRGSGSVSVLREWTDWAEPSALSLPGAPRLALEPLLELVKLVESLSEELDR
jgi:hypothetical protein